MKLDVLVFAAHPDDAELSCAGTIISLIKKGKKVGVVDFTKGEMGTRGTPEVRLKESAEASKVMGIQIRQNLGFKDAYFTNDQAHQLEVVKSIRFFQPEVVLTNAPSDRHPDHGRAAEVVKQACFMAGLAKLVTKHKAKNLAPHRPRALYHFIQNNYIEPDFVVDVSDYWAKKLKAIKCFKSQFYNPESTETETFISSPEFLEFIQARSKVMGHKIGVKHGEGFIAAQKIGVDDLFLLK